MSVALSALRTDLRARFRDVAGNFISAVPANLYLNLAFEDFANDVEPNWREYGFYVTSKQYAYTPPADLLHSLTMMWYQNGQYEIPYLSPQEFKSRGYLNRRISVSVPQAYTFIDGVLYLGPAPGTTSNTTTLNGAVSSTGATTIALTDPTKFQSPAGMFLVDTEQIAYQANDGTTPGNVTLCRRGMGGTTAATHLTLATCQRLDLVMTYTYAFKFMSADTDTPTIPAQFQRVPMHYALALALKQDGRDKQAEAEFKEYTMKRLEAKRQVRLLTRDKNNRRISTAYA